MRGQVPGAQVDRIQFDLQDRLSTRGEAFPRCTPLPMAAGTVREPSLRFPADAPGPECRWKAPAASSWTEARCTYAPTIRTHPGCPGGSAFAPDSAWRVARNGILDLDRKARGAFAQRVRAQNASCLALVSGPVDVVNLDLSHESGAGLLQRHLR